MKKIITSFLLICSFVSCCEDEIITSYDIPEDAKDVVPFHRDITLTYLSQQDIEFTAVAESKELSIHTERPGPESCDLIASQTLSSTVFIDIFEYGFEFILQKDYHDQLLFSVKRFWKDGGYQNFQIQNCEEITSFTKDRFTDIEINGYSYDNVLILESCELPGDINRIIYSPERGVEYIDFTDGRFLVLIDN